MEEGPRNAPSPRGGVILVSLYSWTTVTVGAAIARLIIGRLHQVGFGRDDGAVIIGTFFYLGATVAWHFAVGAGLGKHLDKVAPRESERYFRAMYAAQLLQIVAMALAKTSSILLIDRVAPQTLKHKAFLFGMVVFWTIYSVLAFALGSGLPEPWEFGPDRGAGRGLVESVISLNILSDLVLAGWLLPILRDLHMDRTKRFTVAILFGARAIVPFAAGAQAWAASKAMRSKDPTWDSFELAIVDQIVASLSLIVASLPRIKRFLGGGSGMLHPRITETEIALSTRDGTINSSRGDEPLKLVPSSTKFTATIMSDSEKRRRGSKSERKIQQEWQKFMAMGSNNDEHTSVSSLVEDQDTIKQEVTIHVEEDDEHKCIR